LSWWRIRVSRDNKGDRRRENDRSQQCQENPGPPLWHD